MKRTLVAKCLGTLALFSSQTSYSQISSVALEYAETRPIQALDLSSPLRFKPVLGAELGFVTLGRSEPDGHAFVQDANGNTLLDMANMQGEAGAGFDGVLNLYNLFSDCKAIDVNLRYFASKDISYDEVIRGNSVTPLFYNGVPIVSRNDRRFEYETDLDSGEANLGVRLLPRTRFIGGFRYLRIDERFDITRVENNTTTGFFSQTYNRFYGGQAGIEAVPITGRWGQIQGAVKYAVGNNNIGGNALASSSGGSPLTTTVSGDSDASLLDLQLGGTLFLTRSISFYGGYQGLIVEDVATAPEQVENASLFTTLNAPSRADVQYHGASIRFVGTW